MPNPLAALDSNKLLMNKVENVPVGYQTEQTLLDVSGPGNVVSLWMAVGGGNNPALDGHLHVYYDNSTTKAIDIDLGTLFATHWGADGSHSSTHMHVEILNANFNTGFLMTFPLPFGQHIKVAYYNPSTTQTAYVYSMASYRLTATDEANGQRLRCSGKRFMDQAVTRQPGDVTTLLQASGGPGTVVWHSMVGGVDAAAITPGSANNDSWMERNVAFYVDGETSPSVQSTGTEDWYDSAWYFEGWKDYNTSFHSYVGTDKPSQQPHVVAMATDLWSKYGGIPFQSSVTMQMLTEPACITGDRFVWAVLYYS